MCYILGFIFRSLIHLKLNFENSVRSEFTFFACGYTIFPASFVKKPILSSLNFLDTIVKSQLTINIRIYFSQLHFSLSCIFIFILMTMFTTDFDYNEIPIIYGESVQLNIRHWTEIFFLNNSGQTEIGEMRWFNKWFAWKENPEPELFVGSEWFSCREDPW